jgi:hypothetical protein
MLRVNRTKKELVKLEKRTLPDLGLTEPYDLQQMIRNSPEAFFAEMEETLLLLGEEIRPMGTQFNGQRGPAQKGLSARRLGDQRQRPKSPGAEWVR